MNFLEKVGNLLSKDGRHIKYGTMTTETYDTLITLEVGESSSNTKHLGDQSAIEWQTLRISVFSVDYISGYNLMETLKTELKSAQTDIAPLMYVNNEASEYDKDKLRYIFKSKFKMIL